MTQSKTRTAMPGAFNFEHHQDRGSAPRLSGAKSHIFQPPRTPSASASSSLYLTRSATGSIASTEADRSAAAAGRKRSRVDYSEEAETTPMEWSATDIMGDFGSPAPFVNTRYVLAGGIDTPNLAGAVSHEIGESEYSDVGYRTGLTGGGVKSLFGEHDRSFFPHELPHQKNGLPRVPSLKQYHSDGWSRTALEVVGGVVGKVWEFCKSSAFLGFHAGGGKGYSIPAASVSASHIEIQHNFWESEKQAIGVPAMERESTAIPGRFPDEDLIPDYMDRATPEGTPPRAAKRRQVSRNQDEITKNWVVVPPTEAATPSSKILPRGPARYSMPTASSSGRRSTAGRPNVRGGAAASGARRPILQSRVSHAGSPNLQLNKGASFASPRSSVGKIASITPINGARSGGAMRTPADSPAAIEAQKWAALKRKEEREADESIRRLDAQLKAMIREGKEALGTKIEVDTEDEF